MSSTRACVTVEGSLIGAELLDEIANGKAQGQKPADFNLEARHLTDEIAAAWTEARAFWSSFQRQLARPTKNETGLTRDQWLTPLLRVFGYEITYSPKAAEVDGVTYAISHRAGTDEDTPPLHLVGWQQSLDRRAESGRPRLSPHALMQEYLNRTEHLWGVIANGQSLRLLRDSQLIRRQSYIEFDLRQMMEAEKFAEFGLLFRLLHRTRLPRGMADAKDCLLEQYHQQTIEQGGRVREKLRAGVEQALKLFANALLRHPKNERLKEQLNSGAYKAEDFYQQLLRLIYRLLFLMVGEERDLLKASAEADTRTYRENYSVERLRRLLHIRAAYKEEYDDLWLGLQSLFKVFQDDKLAEILNLSPLNGDLFDTGLTRLLADSRISNRDLLAALWPLAMYQPENRSAWQRVNYRDLNVEELGSIYESLLDYHPVITLEYGKPVFNLVFGSERKSTGSYYTPPALVNELIESALVPVIQDRLSKVTTRDEQAQAILNIKVCDPACGSGHFLLAAARQLGLELARIRSGEQEPTPEERREATRDVIGECIYGVDKNPLAVDLCKVALWIEGNSRGKPLKFIDHRIRCGDSLVGVFDLSVLTAGIPDEAFEPVGGDDKQTARELKRRNRAEREQDENQGDLPFDPEAELQVLTGKWREMLRIRDDSVAEANRKKSLFRQLRDAPELLHEQQACNLWTGAFFVDLTADNVAQERIPTTKTLTDFLTNHKAVDARLTSLTEPLASIERLRFFHWPLEFPEVFEIGGFDVVLGNPPWERIKLQEQEFFGERDLEIASAPNKAARGRLIATLYERKPELWREFHKAIHDAEATSKLLRHGRRYPLTARGDINTYAIFAEHIKTMLNAKGQAGFIVPTGIATDDSCKNYFASVMKSQHVVSLFDFENRRYLFPTLHTKTKFCLLTITRSTVERPSFCFLSTKVDDLRDKAQVYSLSASDLQLINPNTLTSPLFRTRDDAELTRKIYERVPVLVREAQEEPTQPEENPWGIKFSTMFHMSNDSDLFRNKDEMAAAGFTLQGNRFVRDKELYLPLYEAKMMWQFDHRYGTHEGMTERTKELNLSSSQQHADPNYEVLPWYWVSFREVMLRSTRVPDDLLKAYKQDNENKVIETIVAWVAGWCFNYRLEEMQQAKAFNPFAGAADHRFSQAFIRASLRPALSALETEHPLTEEEVDQICLGVQQESSAYEIAETLMKLKMPKWLLGFRDITDTRNERTTVFSLLPQAGVGHTMPLVRFQSSISANQVACFLANLDSFAFDYIARQKVGGMHMTYSYLKQLPVLPPSDYSSADIELIAPRVLELVYTSHDLKAFAEDCGYAGEPFRWDEERRALLRAELDAYFARLYGLTRDEIRYILDPKEVKGKDFPSETFRVLKDKEIARFGEYRTQRLVLEAWDRLS